MKAAGRSGGLRGADPLGRGWVPTRPPVSESVLDAWRTSSAVTDAFVAGVPTALWTTAVPGAPRRTIGAILVHLHNARVHWIRTLGESLGVSVPARLERTAATPRRLRSALARSSAGIEALLVLGLDRDGRLPASPRYVWRNLPLDVGHVLAYFVAHEAHHRGQVVLAARAIGARLPDDVVHGLWQWRAHQRGRSAAASPSGRRSP